MMYDVIDWINSHRKELLIGVAATIGVGVGVVFVQHTIQKMEANRDAQIANTTVQTGAVKTHDKTHASKGTIQASTNKLITKVNDAITKSKGQTDAQLLQTWAPFDQAVNGGVPVKFDQNSDGVSMVGNAADGVYSFSQVLENQWDNSKTVYGLTRQKYVSQTDSNTPIPSITSSDKAVGFTDDTKFVKSYAALRNLSLVINPENVINANASAQNVVVSNFNDQIFVFTIDYKTSNLINLHRFGLEREVYKAPTYDILRNKFKIAEAFDLTSSDNRIGSLAVSSDGKYYWITSLVKKDNTVVFSLQALNTTNDDSMTAFLNSSTHKDKIHKYGLDTVFNAFNWADYLNTPDTQTH